MNKIADKKDCNQINDYIEKIHSRIFDVFIRYRIYITLYENKEIIKAWEYFGFLGGVIQLSLINSILIDIRSLLDRNNRKLSLYKLFNKIEYEKKYDLSNDKKELEKSFFKIRGYINENIAHKTNHSKINSIKIYEVKNIIDEMKKRFNEIVTKYYKISYAFGSVDEHIVDGILKNFNLMLLKNYQKAQEERERYKIKYS
jgi:hypothetical protein